MCRQVVGGAENAVFAQDQWVVVLERHDHCAITAGADLVQAMVKELAENREEGVERGRQTLVRRDVSDEQRTVRGHLARGDPVVDRHCGRVRGALVRDQVADGAGRRVKDVATGLRV